MTLPPGLDFARIVGTLMGISMLVLAGMLAIEKIGHANTRTDLADMTRLRGEERASHQQTKDNFTAAMAKAKLANADRNRRVAIAQAQINEDAARAYQDRITAARTLAAAERLRRQGSTPAPIGRGAGIGDVPTAGEGTGRIDAAPAQSGLPLDDALIATEQAIQLDELITWLERQGSIDINAAADGQPAAKQAR